ncbi:S41 family peptidase [Aneurinibacillus sp. Ricciae_BoGa-3]|uniref:S41 family peptidase n=1 Tax=Aneurinibacillus sp. Ricciae_BoGa-3 TaxID=3022697 RepID=UPI003FA4A751
MKRRTLFLIILVTVLSTGILTLAGVKIYGQVSGRQVDSQTAKAVLGTGDSTGKNADLKKVMEAYLMIQSTALEKVDKKKLIDGAVEGMVSKLNDPFSNYMNQQQTSEFNSSIQSTFQGIGAEVTLKNGKVTIVSPFKGSPAEKAGLKPDDQIVKVNGSSTEGLNLNETVTKIRGPKGTKVVLQIMRTGLSSPMSVSVTRDDIPIETVYADTVTKDGKTFGKIEITQFSENTAKHFHTELQKLESKHIAGLIVDVRDDPGGLLNAVSAIGNELIPNKGIILQVQYGDGQKQIFHSQLQKAPFPVVALINKGSASASEILGGALQDNGYKLVGTQSFGKGTVQSTIPLQDDSQLKLTVAKWLTPKGRWIHKKGLTPDVKVDQPEYFSAAPLPAGKELKLDMNGADVRNLQVILKGLDLAPGRSDGYFDNGTMQAVKTFQNQHSLPGTGVVDAKTAQSLQAEIVKRIKDPKNDLQLQAAIDVLAQSAK